MRAFQRDYGCWRVLEMGKTALETELLVDDHGKTLRVLFNPAVGWERFLLLTVADPGRSLGSPGCLLLREGLYCCLLHFRNQQHHTILDRHVALDALSGVRRSLQAVQRSLM